MLDLSCYKLAGPSLPDTSHGSTTFPWLEIRAPPTPASSGSGNQHFKYLSLVILIHNWFVWVPCLPGRSADKTEIKVSCLGPKDLGLNPNGIIQTQPFKAMFTQANSVHI